MEGLKGEKSNIQANEQKMGGEIRNLLSELESKCGLLGEHEKSLTESNSKLYMMEMKVCNLENSNSEQYIASIEKSFGEILERFYAILDWSVNLEQISSKCGLTIFMPFSEGIYMPVIKSFNDQGGQESMFGENQIISNLVKDFVSNL